LAWALLPLVGLATAAAINASRALISGAFSLAPKVMRGTFLRPAAAVASTTLFATVILIGP